MRSAILTAALALGACASDGGDEGEARAGTERGYDVGDFDRVSLAGPHDVIVTVGGPASVRAEGPARALDRLAIRVEDGRLRIENRRKDDWNWWGGGSGRAVTVHVTVPALTGAAVAGSGDMRVDRVEGERFAASVTGSGGLAIERVRVAEASFSVAGSGGLRAAGAARRASASVAGSGELDLGGLETADASISVTGSGDVGMMATRTASVDLRGSGNVTVEGPARCTVNKAGSGDVRCGG